MVQSFLTASLLAVAITLPFPFEVEVLLTKKLEQWILASVKILNTIKAVLIAIKSENSFQQKYW